MEGQRPRVLADKDMRCNISCSYHGRVRLTVQLKQWQFESNNVYAQKGQTLKQVVDSLPSNGGVVVLGAGAWTSGYIHGGFISKPNITIRG